MLLRRASCHWGHCAWAMGRRICSASISVGMVLVDQRAVGASAGPRARMTAPWKSVLWVANMASLRRRQESGKGEGFAVEARGATSRLGWLGARVVCGGVFTSSCLRHRWARGSV